MDVARSTPLIDYFGSSNLERFVGNSRLTKYEDEKMGSKIESPRPVPGNDGPTAVATGYNIGNQQISVVLLAYNQERFIRDAVESVLSQDYEPLEIILSDDASTDATFQIMEQVVADYRGPHKVKLRRSDSNNGLIRHLNTVIDKTTSEYIVAAAGDDVSEPHRVAVIASVLNSKPSLVYSDYSAIDADGNTVAHDRVRLSLPHGDIGTVAVSTSLYVGATGVWHRDLFEKFPPISEHDSFEDLVLGYRAALRGRVEYIPAKLVRYRIGTGMTTAFADRRSAVRRTATARISSLQQRIIDTIYFAPERPTLITKINYQIKVENAILSFSIDRLAFIRNYCWRVTVVDYFARASLRRLKRWLRRNFG